MPSLERLFVYGTLRPPSKESEKVLCFNHPKIIPFLHTQQPAILEGAVIYDLGSFPAAIPGEGRAIGVLFEIDPAAFEVLDPLEGHPEIYHREIVEVLVGGEKVEAWIYWAPLDLAAVGKWIESGDWLNRS